MDQRQAQVKERAGLDEARINQEFVEQLRKYGPYVLFAFAAVAGVYFLYQQRTRAASERIDTAFVKYDEAVLARSPKGLVAVADEHPSDGAVPFLSMRDAADAHLEAFRTGVPVGTTLTPEGNLPEGTSLLTDEQRQAELASAESLYRKVAEATGSGAGNLIVHMSAQSGLAAVAESRGEIDKAKAAYEQIVTKAKAAGFEGLAKAAQKRIETLPTLAQAPKLLARADLPGQPATPPVMMSGGMVGRTADGKEIPLGGLPSITGADGQPIQLQPMPPGFTPPGFNPDGTKKDEPGATPPTPAPAPAPGETPAAPPADAPKP